MGVRDCVRDREETVIKIVCVCSKLKALRETEALTEQLTLNEIE